MACINMFNPDHPAGGLPMSPRISFSNDFAVDPPPPSTAPRRSTIDPDFEFSAGNRPMMAADELFYKGRMLPLRGGESPSSCIYQQTAAAAITTLRDELRADQDDWPDSARPPKGSAMRWKEFLGIKKTSSGYPTPGKKNETDAAEGSTCKHISAQEQSSDRRAAAGNVEIGLS